MSRPKHVVVIGAGITGALTAHRLLEAGVAVTILEAKEKGAGSSSRSAACLRQQFSTASTVAAMLYSVRSYREFREEFRCDPSTGDVLVQNGYLFLHDRPDFASDQATGAARVSAWEAAQRNVAMQQSVGLTEVELLAPEDIEGRFPHVDPARLTGATFCPTDGFLHPDIVYMEGFRRVQELGGVLRQNERVEGGVFDSTGRLRAVRTSKGEEVAADVFVNATNAWGAKLGASLGGSELPVVPVKRYLYFLQRGPGLTPETLRSWPMTITSSRAYCRPENGDQLLLGWAHSTAGEAVSWDGQDSIEPEFFHKSGLDNYGYAVWMELAESLPALEEFAGLDATTAGYYAVTPDHNPFLGFDPKQPALLHALGFSGHGAMMGPFTAAVIAQMALQGETIESITLDSRHIDLRPLLVGRTPAKGEGMVI
jgi:glycine/D-amino acid oxidase-like deaminating enzyme